MTNTNRNALHNAICSDVGAASGYWNERKQPYNPIGTNHGTMPRCEQEDGVGGEKTRRTAWCILPANFGKRLRIERKNRGMTRNGLYLKTGISRSAIERLESGNGKSVSERNYDAIKRLAKEWKLLDLFNS